MVTVPCSSKCVYAPERFQLVETSEGGKGCKLVNAETASDWQPMLSKFLHLMKSCDPEKNPDFISLIHGSEKNA